MEREEIKCGAVFDKYVCDRLAGHKSHIKHAQGSVRWTDAGAQMIIEQREKEKAGIRQNTR